MHIILYMISGACFFMTSICFIYARSTFHETTGGVFLIAGLISLIGGTILGNQRKDQSHHYGSDYHYHHHSGPDPGYRRQLPLKLRKKLVLPDPEEEVIEAEHEEEEEPKAIVAPKRKRPIRYRRR